MNLNNTQWEFIKRAFAEVNAKRLTSTEMKSEKLQINVDRCTEDLISIHVCDLSERPTLSTIVPKLHVKDTLECQNSPQSSSTPSES
jgi:hypothetical protein